MTSVVIIFLDAEPFLKDAVDSVLGQTTGDWELLLVDDGSRDGSTAIARDYAAAHPPNIRYLEHDGHCNRGMSASRNLGIRHARGATVAFLDADDVWRPEHLATLQSVLDRHAEAGLAYTRPMLWDSASGATVPEPAPAAGMQPLPTDAAIPPPQALLRFLSRTAPTPCPSGMLVRRELLERVGGFEERFTGMYEDQAFVAKACLASSVTISAASTLLYRQHPDSCYARARRSGQREAARRTFLEWFAGYLRETGVGGEIAETVRRERAQLESPRMIVRILRRVTRAVRARGRREPPPVRRVRLGDLRRRTPLSRRWGLDRGVPIDRAFIEPFLACHARDVSGRVLEVGTDRYARLLGAPDCRIDVLDVRPAAHVTVIADLANGTGIPDATYDCFIATQCLQYVDDPRAVVATAARILRPGGVLLLTVPGISRVTHDDGSWLWTFTTRSIERLLAAAFPGGECHVEAAGNVLAAVAFLHGMAAEELARDELHYVDPEFPVVVMARAVKGAA